MALLDSTAAFAQRLVELGLGHLGAEFQAKGFRTFADFAFSSRFTPAMTDDTPFVEVVNDFGVQARARMPAFRRLIFECHTYVAADMQARTTRTDDDPPRKMPQAERVQRWTALKGRLTGLTLANELEPSHELIDKVSDMHHANQLKYIQWKHYTKRQAELKGEKVVKYWQEDANGMMKAHQVGQGAGVANLTTDLLLKCALQRRGLGYEVGGIMTYEPHDTLVNRLIAEFQSDVPPHCHKVSLEQIRAADVKAHELLSELTAEGIRLNSQGVLPMDAAMPGVLADNRFALLLTPIARAAGAKRESKEDGDEPPPKRRRDNQKERTGRTQRETDLEREVAKLKASLKGQPPRGGRQERTSEGQRPPPSLPGWRHGRQRGPGQRQGTQHAQGARGHGPPGRAGQAHLLRIQHVRGVQGRVARRLLPEGEARLLQAAVPWLPLPPRVPVKGRRRPGRAREEGP